MKLIFDTKDAAEEFKSVFYNMISEGYDEFSIADAKYLFPKEDNNLSVTMPWNDIFKGFHMTNENGKYVLEFIIDLQGGK